MDDSTQAGGAERQLRRQDSDHSTEGLDLEVVETDPTGRYSRFADVLGRGACKTGTALTFCWLSIPGGSRYPMLPISTTRQLSESLTSPSLRSYSHQSGARHRGFEWHLTSALVRARFSATAIALCGPNRARLVRVNLTRVIAVPNAGDLAETASQC